MWGDLAGLGTNSIHTIIGSIGDIHRVFLTLLSWITISGPHGLSTVEAFLMLPDIKTSQELRMLSTITLNCQVTMIVRNSGSQF